MSRFGLKIRLTVLLAFFVGSTLLFGQTCIPALQNCNENKCGGVQITLITDDNNVFCQGKSVTLKIDKDKTSTLDSFIVYWCDGLVDRYKGDIFEFNHVFNVNEEEICSKESSSFFVYVVGKKKCTEGVSCRTIGASISLFHEPRAKFTASPTVCIDRLLNFADNSCNVDTKDSTNYLWKFHDGSTRNGRNVSKRYNTTGTYNVELTVSNQCGSHTIVQSVNVVDFPDAKVEISAFAEDDVVCVGDRVRLIDKSNRWSNTQWIFPAGNINRDTTSWKITEQLRNRDLNSNLLIDSIPFMDTLEIDFLQTGTYRYELRSTNVCATVSWIKSIRVEARPQFSWVDPPQFCDSASYRPIVRLQSGTVKSYLWNIEGANISTSDKLDPGNLFFTKPGSYKLKLKAESECDTITEEKVLVVNSRDPVNILTPTRSYCKNGGPDTLKTDRTGGRWSGLGIVNASLGIFNPVNLNPGNYELTYTIGPTGCQTSARITVAVQNSTTSRLPEITICDNALPTNIQTGLPQGQWTTLPYLTNAGIFDPSKSGVGRFELRYNYPDSNQCNSLAQLAVVVERKPILPVFDTVLVCKSSNTILLDKTLNIDLGTLGGVVMFSIDKIAQNNNLDLNNFRADIIKVDISYTKSSCTIDTFAYLRITEKQNLVLNPDTIICIENESLQLSTNVASGTWQGPNINNRGIINLQMAGSGRKTYSYSVFKGTSCELNGTVNVDIIDGGANVMIGGNEEVCVNQANYTLSGFSPLSGQWSGQGVNSSGTIDLSQIRTDSSYTYTYCLTENLQNNCISCKSKNIIFRDLPSSDFAISGKECINQELTFTPAVANPIDNYSYAINGSPLSNTITTKTSFSDTGTYNVVLQVQNRFGCLTTTSKRLNIARDATIDFNISNTSGCEPFIINAQNTSSANATEFKWVISDTVFSTRNVNPVTIDNLDSTTTIKVILIGGNKCSMDSLEENVTIFPKPKVNFGLSELEGCSPLEINFSNISKGNAGNFTWKLGNGSTSTQFTPPTTKYFTVIAPQDYQINLSASNQCGTDSLSKIITVFPPNVTAFIEKIKDNYCQDDTLRLNSFSTLGAVSSWKVLTPIGTEVKYQGSSMSQILTEIGEYTIILVAKNCGEDEDSIMVTVHPKPSGLIKIPELLCEKNNYQFSYEGDNIGAASWNIQGIRLSGSKVSHTFTNSGKVPIALSIASQQFGCITTIQDSLFVRSLPTINIQPDILNGCEPLDISFNSTNAAEVNYTISMATNSYQVNNNSYKISLQNGEYLPKIRAVSKEGCVDSTVMGLIKVYPKPIIDFDLQKNTFCINTETVITANKSTVASSFQWQTNSEFFNTKNINFVPRSIGNFFIRLTGISEFGCRDSLIKNFIVINSPIAAYIIPDKICFGESVTLLSNSLHSNQNLWKINKDAFSNNAATNFKPSTTGSFNIDLIATSSFGCKPDTLSKTITVNPSPIAKFTLSDSIFCGIPARFSVTNNSNNFDQLALTINGSLIGGNVSLENININTFGRSEIKVNLRNNFGCQDSTAKIVEVFPKPVSKFTSPTVLCDNTPLLLSSQSTNTSQFLWEISNGAKFSGRNVTIDNPPAGEMKIKHIAVFNQYCSDTSETNFPIIIFKGPTADFDYETNFDNARLGEVRFINKSINFTSLFWNLGDGTTSAIENIVHEYSINRPITINLITSKNYAEITCYDTITKLIEPEWITTFYAPNAISPESGPTETRFFKPVGIGIKTYHIRIFSPWGQEIWSSKELSEGAPSEAWDGSIKTDIAPQGSYTWIAEIEFDSGNKKTYTGNVTVVR